MADISSILSELLAGQRQQIQSSNPYLIASSIVPQVQQRKGKGATSSIVANALLGLTKGALAGYGTADANSEFNDYVSGMVPMLNNPAGMYDKKYAPIASALAADQAMRTAALDDKRIDKGLDLQNNLIRDNFKGEIDKGVEAAKLGFQQPLKNEQDLVEMRKEFQSLPEVRAYVTSSIGYRSLQKAIQDPASTSDLELIRGAIQSIEPGMAVREGEQYAVQNSGSIPDQWKGAISKAILGESGLAPDVREGILRIAERRFGEYQNQFNQAKSFYTNQASRRGFQDPAGVTYINSEQPVASPAGKQNQAQSPAAPGMSQNQAQVITPMQEASPNPMPTPAPTPMQAVAPDQGIKVINGETFQRVPGGWKKVK